MQSIPSIYHHREISGTASQVSESVQSRSRPLGRASTSDRAKALQYEIPTLMVSLEEGSLRVLRSGNPQLPAGSLIQSVGGIRVSSKAALIAAVIATCTREYVLINDVQVPLGPVSMNPSREELLVLCRNAAKPPVAEAGSSCDISTQDAQTGTEGLSVLSSFDSARLKEEYAAVKTRLLTEQHQVQHLVSEKSQLITKLREASAQWSNNQTELFVLQIRSFLRTEETARMVVEHTSQNELQEMGDLMRSVSHPHQPSSRRSKVDVGTSTTDDVKPAPAVPSSNLLRVRGRAKPAKAKGKSLSGSTNEVLVAREESLAEYSDGSGSPWSGSQTSGSYFDNIQHSSAPTSGCDQSTWTSKSLLCNPGNEYELRTVLYKGVPIARVPFSLWGDVEDDDIELEANRSVPGGLSRAPSGLMRGKSFKGKLSEDQLRLKAHLEKLYLDLRTEQAPRDASVRVRHIVGLLRQSPMGLNSDVALFVPVLEADELLTVWRLHFNGTVSEFCDAYTEPLSPLTSNDFELWSRGRELSAASMRECERAVRSWLLDGGPCSLAMRTLQSY